jgi:hypothetical protein
MGVLHIILKEGHPKIISTQISHVNALCTSNSKCQPRMTYCNCILNNIMIGVFIYILRVHHVFHAHTTHELLGYVGGSVTPRVLYFVL